MKWGEGGGSEEGKEEENIGISKSFISRKRRILDHSWPSPASNFIEQKADKRNGTDSS